MHRLGYEDFPSISLVQCKIVSYGSISAAQIGLVNTKTIRKMFVDYQQIWYAA